MGYSLHDFFYLSLYTFVPKLEKLNSHIGLKNQFQIMLIVP